MCVFCRWVSYLGEFQGILQGDTWTVHHFSAGPELEYRENINSMQFPEAEDLKNKNK